MALDGDTLGDLMKAAVDALADEDKADRVAVFRAMGGALVAHVQTSAVVNVTVTTTGTASAQAGSGTGTVT